MNETKQGNEELSGEEGCWRVGKQEKASEQRVRLRTHAAACASAVQQASACALRPAADGAGEWGS